MSEKSKAFVIFSVSRLGPVPGPLGLLRRNVNTVKPDNSSTRLSPPKASSAKLPAIRPDQTEPITSMVIHAELKYSTLMPLPILISLAPLYKPCTTPSRSQRRRQSVRHDIAVNVFLLTNVFQGSQTVVCTSLRETLLDLNTCRVSMEASVRAK